jgi:polysaccharide biosynthesis transport protein
MELKQYGLMLWRWMWLIVLATGIAVVFSFLGTLQSPRIYQATSTILVGQSIQNPNPSSGDLYTSGQLALTYIQLAKTEPVLQGMIDALNLRVSTDAVRANINASIVQGTQLIQLSVVDNNPARAQAMANELAHQLILQAPTAQDQLTTRRDFIQNQVDALQAKLQDAQTQIDDLQGSIQVTSSARDIADKQQQVATLQLQVNQWQLTYANLLTLLAPRSPNALSVVDPARLPQVPISPNVPLTVLLAAAIGCLLAVGGAFLIEYIDDTIKAPDDVTQSMKLSVLGVIARITGETPEEKLIAARHPRSSHAEAYRVLRTNIQVADVDRPISTLLITSPNPVEGKSVTAANLAVVMAQAGLRVILVDADMRRPVQHKMFHLANNRGLTEGLMQPSPSLDGILYATETENLKVIPTGQIPPNPAELLGSKRMKALIELLKESADMVIFDTPPCLPLADAAILARQVDGALMVVDSGRTRRDAALRAKEALERAGAHILGVALNRVSAHSSGYYYYYYYYSDDSKKKKRSSNHSRLPWGLGSRLSKEIPPPAVGPEND